MCCSLCTRSPPGHAIMIVAITSLQKRERLELIEEIASHVDTIQLLSSERQAQAQLLDELTSRLHSSGGAPRSYSAMFSQHRASSASAGSTATPSPSSAGTRAPTPDGAFRPQSAVTASGQQRQKRTPSPVPSVRSYRSDRNPVADKEEVDPMLTRAKLVIRNM